MNQPEGFVHQGKEELVCKLKKSIYGLKQSPRCWNSTLDTHLKDLRFTQMVSDPCIYHQEMEGEMPYIGVYMYVDDIILAGKTERQLQKLKDDLAKRFDIKDLGSLQHFLGIKIVQDSTKGFICIGQPAYAENLLKRLNIEDCKPYSTPVKVSEKLLPGSEQDEPIGGRKPNVLALDLT